MNQRVLLVEDNPDDEMLTLRAFRQNNIANPVLVVRDGAEAIACLHADQAEEFALVLLDLKLPKLSGLEVLQMMRADPRTNLTPVVVLTSSREEADIVESYSLGANSFVRKPVDFNAFVRAAATLGLYWLVLNEAPPPP